MNPQLQNYINQSRASGMDDNAIKKTLSSQGWSETDISQALGLGSGSPMSATASVVAGGMSGKIIGIIFGILVVGGGAYFMYHKHQAPQQNSVVINPNPSTNNNYMTQETPDKQVTCKDLLSDEQFQSVFNLPASDFNLGQSGSMVPYCSYTGKPGAKGLPVGSYVPLAIMINQGGDQTGNFEYLKGLDPSRKTVDVSGVGSEAYTYEKGQYSDESVQLQVLSTNRKFALLITVDYILWPRTVVSKADRSARNLEMAENIAKFIDTKLNKY